LTVVYILKRLIAFLAGGKLKRLYGGGNASA